jgi:hypothetical protein
MHCPSARYMHAVVGQYHIYDQQINWWDDDVVIKAY